MVSTLLPSRIGPLTLLVVIFYFLINLQGICASNQQCKEVEFSVSGTAENRNITTAPLGNVTALALAIKADKFPRVTISGKQTLVGWYCTPAVVNENNHQLQVLLGSITTNREAYTALGGTGLYGFPSYEPELYSWVQYAGSKGYPTLSLDRLGSGKSSHPDPGVVVQGAYEYALYHDLAQQIRKGTTGSLDRKYSTLIFVGNSYGSVTGNNLAARYPDDFDAFVLTGFSKSVLPSLAGVALQNVMPASTVWPARFAKLSGAYLTSPHASSRTDSFFGDPKFVDFDPVVAQLYWAREDVVSTGQFISTYADITRAPAYKGRVLVVTGEQDQAFCGPGSSKVGKARCGTLLEETGSLFPNAEYNFKSIERTGHAIFFHRSVRKTFDIIDQFLDGERLEG
ncbi:hypothetical protein FKW77_004502 [Venturia effusa]|uniref:AB hydrolase-1 domain-containing protein n=1 Tax=Venturia effusa TaxID=50376 RepID=A0A517KW92_9PEZI|nr:hypothetical protein FKW77_004502 [Venturia effusa]